MSAERGELQALVRHLQREHEEERASAARAIHDELGQGLAGLKMTLSWLLARIVPRDGELEPKLALAISQVDDLIRRERALARRLRPGVLDHFGLPAALIDLAAETERRTGIACRARCDEEIPRNADIETALYRTCADALRCALERGEVRAIDVTLSALDGSVTLEVRDDGTTQESSWLEVSMRERALALGGAWTIDRAPGGTTVRATVPLDGGDRPR